MGDATVPTLVIMDQVKRQIDERLKQLRLPIKVSEMPLASPLTLTHSSTGKRKTSTSTWPVEEGEDSLPKRQRLRQGFFNPPQAQDTRLAQERQAGAQERGQERKVQGLNAWAGFLYERPLTYPDFLLDLPTPDAVKLLLARAPLAMVEAAKFRSHVHLGPGVVVPERFSIHISSGLRYMFSPPIDTRLIKQAWEQTKNSIRWRIHFAYKEQNSDLEAEPYDPDYEIPSSGIPPKKSDKYIEAGLSQGDLYVRNYMDVEIPVIKQLPKPASLVFVADLERFLKENDYLILPTDKNLGTSVVTRQWFIENCLLLLSDVENYREIDNSEVKETLARTRTSVDELATFVDTHMSPNKQLSLYLRSKIPKGFRGKPSIPAFYGIPKIHKKPTKMRPIVPCHSILQTPAAKYVSKQMKSLLLACPYVLRGSKDLAMRLSSVKVPVGKKIWLISGDIIAFYPSVDLHIACRIAIDSYIKFYPNASAALKHFFARCVRLANQDLIMTFNGKHYLQQRGLAMGVACSPDIANCYGAYYEDLCGIQNMTEVLFFGRFIDDVLGVVEASSAEEALLIASRITYGSVKLTWEVSEWNTPFLDMLVYIDPTTNQVEHTPFRKALNHTERIPFASHHPKDVKKGTFLGEMSRLATLSSKRSHYLDAVRELGLLYIARGYPGDLVNSWIKNYLAVRWADRLSEPSSAGVVFVLKSTFNPVWSRFNVQDLGQRVKETWISELLNEKFYDPRSRTLGESSRPSRTTSISLFPPAGISDTPRDTEEPVGSAERFTKVWKDPTVSFPWPEAVMLFDVRKSDFLDRRFLVSRKRTRNLGDFVHTWNKAVLSTHTVVQDDTSLYLDDMDF